MPVSKTEQDQAPAFGFTPQQVMHRITRFSRFKEMVEEKKLALVSCGKWDDQNEGPLAQKLRTMEGIRQVQQILSQRGIDLFTPIIMDMFRRKTYMQCWTAAHEKVRMWEEYSKSRDSVRFTTTLGKIQSIAPLHIFEVDYCSELPVDKEIENIFADMDGLSVITMTEIFRRKHTDYAFEEEVRLMYNNMVFDMSEDMPGIKKLSFEKIPDFVEGVIVDPRASPELLAEVGEFCGINSIPFNGRSSLKMD